MLHIHEGDLSVTYNDFDLRVGGTHCAEQAGVGIDNRVGSALTDVHVVCA